jgi:8-oxo-dGTP pyrophosphatase MutT (NUDIX family)
MKLKDLYRNSDDIKKATLCFLIKDGKVLLAMKKRGFGVGKWNGVGGKLLNGESSEEAAVRETQEEVEVIVKKLKKAAVLHFYFENNKDWDQMVTVYLAKNWTGWPKETEEMAPKWFKFENIPYAEMWWDDKLWLPKVLNGKMLEASFLFDDKEKVVDQTIRVVDKL